MKKKIKRGLSALGITAFAGFLGYNLISNPINANAIRHSYEGVPSHMKNDVTIAPSWIQFESIDGNVYKHYGTAKLYAMGHHDVTMFAPVYNGALYSTTWNSYYDVYENKTGSYTMGAENAQLLADKSFSNFKKGWAKANTTAKKDVITTNLPYKNKADKFAGVAGEWRFLGYSETGLSLTNPYFPSDTYSDYTVGSYPWESNPWNKSSKYFPDGMSPWDGSNASTKKVKREAISRLLQQEASMRAKNNNPDYWMDKLSLQNDPRQGTALFKGLRSNGSGGYYYRTITLMPETHNNLYVSKMVVKDEYGNTVSTYTRSAEQIDGAMTGSSKAVEKGKKYTVEVTVKNTSTKATVLNPSQIQVGMATGTSVATSTDTSMNNISATNKRTVTSKGTISAKGSKTFTYDGFSVPTNATGNFTIKAVISDVHRAVGDNLFLTDDDAKLNMSISSQTSDTGNIVATNVELINKDGTVASNPVPGNEYKVRYNYKYTGDDARTATFKNESVCTVYDYSGNCTKTETQQVFDKWSYPKVNLSVTSAVTRTNQGGTTDASNTTISTSVELKNNSTFSVTTKDYIMYEVPKITAVGQIKVSDSKYSQFNSKTTDDKAEKAWNDSYDYSVSNVQILPNKQSITENGTYTFAVKFDVTHSVPSYVKNYAKDIGIRVTIAGKSYDITEHIAQGENKNIVVEVPVNLKTTDKEIGASVYVNYDKNGWEDDLSTQANNKGSASAGISKLTNPTPIPNPNSSDTSVACPQGVTTAVNWKQYFHTSSWTGTKVSYTANGKTYSFYKYNAPSNADQYVNQTEKFGVTKVLFKSKLTEDLGLGDKGWVDLTKEKGYIKAGYGYELKIAVEYSTNAFAFQEGLSYINGGTGKWVRPQHVQANIPNEIYFVTPDKQLKSVSGGDFTYTKTGDKKAMTWEYTIKPKNNFGIKESGKFFVNEETADGVYKVEVFTPTINGVPTKMTSATNKLTTSLCDDKKLQFEVKGSMYDDSNSHIVQ